ncbi:MAG: YbgC/FadM family acyl-CoA thioesterase [Campylobacterota bacterium]|nr:YbgC/FadM family acyl-CoA thioesterase [Campylobacterota bacterium]
MQIRVYYEDTDAGGIVYHSNYLNFCERARSEFFFSKGKLPIIDNCHFVVRKMECDFLRSAQFGDIVDVDTKIVEFKRSSFTLFHEIKKENAILFTATVLLVLVDNGKPKRLTKQIQNTLKELFHHY